MENNKSRPVSLFFENFAKRITEFTGSTIAFIIACLLIIIWLLTGPLFNYSDTWQLVINTGTTIITFLMVFLIQRSQNKDSLAIHLKLNELVAAIKGASNRLIDVENLSEEELTTLHNYFQLLSEKTKTEANIKRTHSVEEAAKVHEEKMAEVEKKESEIQQKNNDEKGNGKK
ncbi:MAG: low affinity iron permease family protein [Bacillota bacterium]